MRKINILDTTLRDGSYAINYAFSSTETANICKGLEEVGVEYIEIGHGVGLNASNAGFGTAAASDAEYMNAANKVLKKSKYGMFCIPGIARLEDLDLARDHNMQFVRIGTDITRVAESINFIKKAKDYNMFVAANFMKSYALPPQQFAEKVKISEGYGADMVYIVDSAGGMFPEDIRAYYEAIRKVSDIPIGFHGHDNLGLAIANTLEATKIGINYIDSSLQGLGRSAGNASTEILVLALMKKGYDLNIDFLNLLALGQKYIQPLITSRGKAPLDIVSGYADFHSSYMHYIQKCSDKYQVSPVLLIIEIGKLDKVNVKEDDLDKIANRIKKDEDFYLGKYGFNKYVGGEQESNKAKY